MLFIGHLLRNALGIFFRALGLGIVFAAASLGVVAYISRYITNQWPPSHLTIAAGIVIAALAGYSVITTTLLRGVAKGAIAVTKDVEKEVTKVV